MMLHFKPKKSKDKNRSRYTTSFEVSNRTKAVTTSILFMTRCFTLPDLYAGKMHALVFRTWNNRVKGRDWYDFEWYVKNGINLDFTHLQERIREFNGIEVDKEEFLRLLKKRLASTDIKMVKQDVEPFIKNTENLEIWSNDYFLQLANIIKFE